MNEFQIYVTRKQQQDKKYYAVPDMLGHPTHLNSHNMRHKMSQEMEQMFFGSGKHYQDDEHNFKLRGFKIGKKSNPRHSKMSPISGSKASI